MGSEGAGSSGSEGGGSSGAPGAAVRALMAPAIPPTTCMAPPATPVKMSAARPSASGPSLRMTFATGRTILPTSRAVAAVACPKPLRFSQDDDDELWGWGWGFLGSWSWSSSLCCAAAVKVSPAPLSGALFGRLKRHLRATAIERPTEGQSRRKGHHGRQPKA